MQTPLFVGLISMFVGNTLPEDIATSARRLLLKGYDILGMVPGVKNFTRWDKRTKPVQTELFRKQTLRVHCRRTGE